MQMQMQMQRVSLSGMATLRDPASLEIGAGGRAGTATCPDGHAGTRGVAPRGVVPMIGNIQKLVLGNGLGQGLQLLALLVFSRIYLPGDFGLLAQVQSIATLACIVARSSCI